MDGNRFDALSRHLTSPATRRVALRALAGGGLLASAAPLTLRRSFAQGFCTFELEAEISAGSNAGERFEGVLKLEIGDGGQIEASNFEAENESFPVVGQSIGRSLFLRIELGNERALTLIGMGERDRPLPRRP
jgi:hypothetical protein